MSIFRTLIDPAQLAERFARRQPTVVLDCRFDLMRPEAGEAAYLQAHLPGAVYVHLERDLSGAKTGRNGRHPLPERADFAARAGAWGISPGVQVVTYDTEGGPFAARAWWLLRWLGHDAVAVLDGGCAAWAGSGGAMEGGSVEPVAAPAYPSAAAEAMPTVGTPDLLARLGRVRLLDARSQERFRGEVEPLDPVAGHIPGATLRTFTANLETDGRFKPADVLRAEFERLAPRAGEVVHQCGSGVTACHNLLAMMHAGLDAGSLYPGSWSEWCADPSRPVAVG